METARTSSWPRRELFQALTSPVKGKNSACAHVPALIKAIVLCLEPPIARNTYILLSINLHKHSYYL